MAMGATGVGDGNTGNRPEGSGVNGVESSISSSRPYAAGVSNDGVGVDNPRERADWSVRHRARSSSRQIGLDGLW